MDGSIIFGLLFWIIIIYIIVLRRVKRSSSQPIIKPQSQLPVQIATSNSKNQQPISNSEQWEMTNWVNHEIYKLNSTLSFNKLVKSRDINSITYNDMLNCYEWKFQRLRILIRDNYQCQDCKAISLSNHVHHIYYIKNKPPWEIQDSALVTLCYDCHLDRHRNEMVPIFKIYQGKLLEDTKEYLFCSRCGGTGYLPQYSHVEGGICFKCWGNKLDQRYFISLLKKAKEKVSPYSDDYLREKYKSYLKNLKVEDFRRVPKD